MFYSWHADIVDPEQALNPTLPVSPEVHLPEVGTLINPASSLDQLVPRLDPSEYVVMVMSQSKFLRIKTLERPK